MRLVAYVRASTLAQEISPAAQAERIEAYARLYGHEVVRLERDAASAKSMDRRPGLERALALICTGEAEGLVVAKLDRLTRSIRDLGDMIDRYFGPKGAALVSVAEQLDTRSASGRLVINVLAAVSQWEREAISERTSAALAHLKSRGVKLGEIPFGTRLRRDAAGEFVRDSDGRCIREPDPDERETIRMIRAARRKGVTYRGVCEMLTEAGRKTRYGGAWLPGTVARVLGLWRGKPVCAQLCPDRDFASARKATSELPPLGSRDGVRPVADLQNPHTPVQLWVAPPNSATT